MKDHLPGLNPDGIGRVAYEPDGGFADPHLLCQRFADRAQAAGANVYVNTPVTGITMSGDKVTGVRTPNGDIDSPIVVNAAGPWAGPIGKMAGLDLPLEISREQEMMLQVPSGASAPQRAVSNMVERIYFRPTKQPGTVLVGVGHPKENEPVSPDNYDRRADPDFIQDAGWAACPQDAASRGRRGHRKLGWPLHHHARLEHDRRPCARRGRHVPRRRRQRPLLQAGTRDRAVPRRDDRHRLGHHR